MKAMYCCRLRLNMRTENVDGTKMSLSYFGAFSNLYVTTQFTFTEMLGH